MPSLFSVESQMLLRETMHKTKASFHKCLRNFRSFFYGRYRKLPRSLSFNAFLCGSLNDARTQTSDRFYNEFYDQLQSELSRITISKSKEQAIGDATSSSSFMSFSKKSPLKRFHEERPKEEKNKGKNSKPGKKEGLKSQNIKKGTHVLAQKMKLLDMMDDAGDLEHLLDIEEALHYYSRLRSPVYLDLVDQFFMDMHSELSVPPQPSASIIRPSKTKQKLGSIQL